MKGRKPIPTTLRILRGNPGHRPLNASEPRPAASIPKCPDALDSEARKEWRRITKELAAVHLLTNLDLAALASYCSAWSRFVQAERELAESGPVIKSPSGYPQLSPFLTVLNQAIGQMRSLLAELGLSPSARTRLHAPPPSSSPTVTLSEVDEA
jgi:P27 family predicted phage terminase small subunit